MNKERLKTGLETMGVAADETALDRFEAFHAILDEYNARMDLTAVLDEDERVDRHDLDSAAPLAHGLLVQGAKVIDVGTGAGFPGMPLLILRPDLQIMFLDALNKRILFLEDALKRLGLTAATLHARAEDAAKMAAHREQYDAAVSRAVANAATLEELTLPFVKKGGVAIAWKGPGVADELTAARRAAFLLGGTVRGTVDAPIPRRADWAHVLLLTDKTGTTPKAYPRKAGTPGKKPLGMYLSSLLIELYIPKYFFAHAASLHQAFAHCAIFPTAASRRSLGRVSVPMWPVTLSGRLLIVGLVGRYLTN